MVTCASHFKERATRAWRLKSIYFNGLEVGARSWRAPGRAGCTLHARCAYRLCLALLGLRDVASGASTTDRCRNPNESKRRSRAMADTAALMSRSAQTRAEIVA